MSVKGIIKELLNWVEDILSHLPGEVGVRLRGFYWRRRIKQCGREIRIGQRVTIRHPGNMVLGDNIIIAEGCCISSKDGGGLEVGNNFTLGRYSQLGGEIKIGNDCLLASHITLMAGNHNYRNLAINIRDQGNIGRQIQIGNDVWIGTRAVILCGVCIGDKVVVGAGAVVTHNVKEATVVGGVPAREIKQRARQ